MCMNNKPQFPKKKITIMGIGGGGMNVINRCLTDNLPNETDNLDFDLICIDTDKQTLETAKTKRILIGTNHIGCGGNVEKGKNAALESREKIINELKYTDILFIITCLGGGTGTGASITISEIAKELNIKTIVLATIPFTFEGKQRVEKAIAGIEELKNLAEVHKYENDVILKSTSGKTTMREAFGTIDKQISNAILEILNENILNL